MIEFHCDECPHIFSALDIEKEAYDDKWGHPCFAAMKGNKRKPGTVRCEAYRACYKLTRIKSPISDDSFEATP